MREPRRIGRYELGRPLGAGASGTVYEALRHGPAGLRRRVALKVLHRASDTLRREARLGGLLRHRHLVDVYEVGEVDGRWFAALELCERGSLAGRPPMPPRAVVEVGLQVCAALAYAHDALGLVHLDLKPANLLVDDLGDVKVADLGLARARGEAAPRRGGTPGYLAPEQARGGPVDARADLHALGVTLIELAVGRPPASPTFGSVDGDLGAPAPPDCPEWLAPAVARCLAEDPEDRWPDARALAAALAAVDARGPGLREVLGISGPPRARPEPAPSPAPIGRDALLADVAARLDRARLLALKGPAGIGKTALARALVAARPGGVLVSLPDPADRADLEAAVAAAIDLPAAGGPPGPRLGPALAARRGAWLVLDGADGALRHLEAAAAWAAVAPELRILVTARAAPPGVAVVEVGPLAPADARELVARRAAARGVEVTDADADALAARFGGVPLALELAAGRLGVLSAADALAHPATALLRDGTDGPHASLRDALDRSWDALDPAARGVLAQLSVFRSPFLPEAAEAVVSPGGEVALELLGQLVDRSLVTATGDGAFVLLGATRDYAANHLDDPTTHDRHAAFFASFGGSEALGALGGPRAAELRAAYRRHAADLGAAFDHAVARDADRAAALLGARWALHGHPDAAAAAAQALLASPSGTAASRCRAARILGEVRLISGHADGAAWVERSRAEAAEAGDALAEVDASWSLAALDSGSPPAAVVARARAAVDRCPPADWRWNPLRGLLASLLARQERWEEARALAEDAARGLLGDGRWPAWAMCQCTLAAIAWRTGDLGDADARFRLAIEVVATAGFTWDIVVARGNRAYFLHDAGRTDEALEELRAVAALARESGLAGLAATYEGTRGHLLCDAGRLDEAEPLLAGALDVHRSAGNARSEGQVLAVLARLAAARGRRAEALAHAAEAVPKLAVHGPPRMLRRLQEAQARWLAEEAAGSDGSR